MDTVSTASDLSQYGPVGIVLGLALIAIGVMYRNEVKARQRAEDRADKWAQRYVDTVDEPKGRRRDDD